MDKFTQHIDKIIQKVLNEAAEEKASEVSGKNSLMKVHMLWVLTENQEV